VQSLKAFHSLGFVHNDIKLENITVSEENNFNKISLIDFGVSTPFLEKDQHNLKKHIKKTLTKKLVGNLLFASKNTCDGYRTSRKDDMESVLYLIIFLLNNFNLPWKNEFNDS
jgi:serine/threonine protein kinase